MQALAFLLSDEELRAGFLALTGADAGSLRAGAGDPAFLGGVLDFLLQDESALLSFSQATETPPDQIGRARGELPGAMPDANW